MAVAAEALMAALTAATGNAARILRTAANDAEAGGPAAVVVVAAVAVVVVAEVVDHTATGCGPSVWAGRHRAARQRRER